MVDDELAARRLAVQRWPVATETIGGGGESGGGGASGDYGESVPGQNGSESEQTTETYRSAGTTVESRHQPSPTNDLDAPKGAVGSYSLSFKCVAPMALGGPMYRDAWGILAHAFLSQDYSDVMGVPRGRDLYLDDSFAGPVDPRYAAFLIRKNPSLPAWAKVFLALTSIKRADVVLHDSTRQEYEEFKPDNIFGIIAGETKLLQIQVYMAALGLSYKRGTSYTPTPMTRSATLAGVPVELWLAARRESNGLVVYKYCIRTDWGLLAWSAVIGLIILIIYLILKGKVPAPSPPGTPPELPPPSPVPIPVPPVPVPVPRLDKPVFGLNDEPDTDHADNGGEAAASRLLFI